MVFTTGVSETAASSATAKMTLGSAGDLEINSGTATAKGAGFVGTVTSHISKVNGVIESVFLVDIQGLRGHDGGSSQGPGQILGDDDNRSNAAFFTQITTAVNGVVFMVEMACIETPTGGDPDIDLVTATENNLGQGTGIATATETSIIVPNANWGLGSRDRMNNIPGQAKNLVNNYLYLTTGAATSNDADYSAGKYMIKLYGVDF